MTNDTHQGKLCRHLRGTATRQESLCRQSRAADGTDHAQVLPGPGILPNYTPKFPESWRGGDVALLTPGALESVAYPPSAAAPKNSATKVSSDRGTTNSSDPDTVWQVMTTKAGVATTPNDVPPFFTFGSRSSAGRTDTEPTGVDMTRAVRRTLQEGAQEAFWPESANLPCFKVRG